MRGLLVLLLLLSPIVGAQTEPLVDQIQVAIVVPEGAHPGAAVEPNATFGGTLEIHWSCESAFGVRSEELHFALELATDEHLNAALGEPAVVSPGACADSDWGFVDLPYTAQLNASAEALQWQGMAITVTPMMGSRAVGESFTRTLQFRPWYEGDFVAEATWEYQTGNYLVAVEVASGANGCTTFVAALNPGVEGAEQNALNLETGEVGKIYVPVPQAVQDAQVGRPVLTIDGHYCFDPALQLPTQLLELPAGPAVSKIPAAEATPAMFPLLALALAALIARR